MNALIYIELIEKPDFIYEKEIINWSKDQFPQISTFDFDNHSDSSMVAYGMELLDKADKTVIIIVIKDEISASFLRGFCEKALKNKNRVSCILIGSNLMIEKMLGLLGTAFIKTISTQQSKPFIESHLKD